MLNRRDAFKLLTAAAVTSWLPRSAACKPINNKEVDLVYCMNTSTISGQKLSLTEMIDITARAGYDGIELWTRDIRLWLDEGNSLPRLQKYLNDSGLICEIGIGGGEWIVDDEDRRKIGLKTMRENMELLSQLNCTRIVVTARGAFNTELNFSVAGERFKDLIELGRKIGVIPHLEFIGPSKSVSTLGHAVNIAIAADDKDAKVLLDLYHLFRGGSGVDGIRLLNGNTIEIIHMNDYPGNIPREEQKDSHRIFPGEGIAPLKQILTNIKAIGGRKLLSLELFNPEYWQMEALIVAKTGLERMKNIVANL